MPSAADLRALAVSFASDLDPDGERPGVDVVEDLAVAAKALAGAALRLARRVACGEEWRGHGHGSAADWFASVSGASVYEARHQLQTAKRLQDLGATASALAAGELSTAQARALTQAATADPSAEGFLLDSARTDTLMRFREKAAQVEAAATDEPEREHRVRSERSKRLTFNPDGSFDLHLHGPATDGVELEALFRPYEEQVFADSPRKPGPGEVRDTYDNRCYDAFLALIGDLLRRPDSGGDAGGRRPRGGQNVKVIVRVDHAALTRGHTVAGETCDVAGAGPLPVSAVRSLLASPDVFVAAVVTKGRDVQTVAHLGRGCNAFQRTAVEWTGLRCSNQACNRTIAIQIDHRTPFAEVPETKLDNQDPLCPDCHRRKTHHGWTLAPGTGPRPFRPPPDPSPDRAEPLRSPAAHRGMATARTLTTA